MAKQHKAWVLKPAKIPSTSVPETIKLELETKAANLIETVLKPKHVVPQKPDIEFNYVSDIGTKWYRKYFYFFATYACPGSNALSPSFESKFARMEYLGGGRFSLSFHRHNDDPARRRSVPLTGQQSAKWEAKCAGCCTIHLRFRKPKVGVWRCRCPHRCELVWQFRSSDGDNE